MPICGHGAPPPQYIPHLLLFIILKLFHFDKYPPFGLLTMTPLQILLILFPQVLDLIKLGFFHLFTNWIPLLCLFQVPWKTEEGGFASPDGEPQTDCHEQVAHGGEWSATEASFSSRVREWLHAQPDSHCNAHSIFLTLLFYINVEIIPFRITLTPSSIFASGIWIITTNKAYVFVLVNQRQLISSKIK